MELIITPTSFSSSSYSPKTSRNYWIPLNPMHIWTALTGLSELKMKRKEEIMTLGGEDVEGDIEKGGGN